MFRRTFFVKRQLSIALLLLSVSGAAEAQNCYEPTCASLQQEIVLYAASQHTYGVEQHNASLDQEYWVGFFPLFRSSWDFVKNYSRWISLSRYPLEYHTYLVNRALLDLTLNEEGRRYYAFLSVPCEIDGATLPVLLHVSALSAQEARSTFQSAYPRCRIPRDYDFPVGHTREEILTQISHWQQSSENAGFLESHFFDYFEGGVRLRPRAETDLKLSERQETTALIADTLLDLEGPSQCLNAQQVRELGDQTVCSQVTIPRATDDNFRLVEHRADIYLRYKEAAPQCILRERRSSPFAQLPRSFQVCYPQGNNPAKWHRHFLLRALIEESALKDFCLPPTDSLTRDMSKSQACIPVSFKHAQCLLEKIKFEYTYQTQEQTHHTLFLREDRLPTHITIHLCQTLFDISPFREETETVCAPRPYLNRAVTASLEKLNELQSLIETIRNIPGVKSENED